MARNLVLLNFDQRITSYARYVPPLSTHIIIPHFLVGVAEEQDSSPLAPSGNREEEIGSHMDEPKGDDTDLLFRIRGLYRLLDLISEQGSEGAGMIKAP